MAGAGGTGEAGDPRSDDAARKGDAGRKRAASQKSVAARKGTARTGAARRDVTKPPLATIPGPAGPAWSRWVGRFLAKVVWSTRVVNGSNLPLDGPVLVAANHTGLMDGPVVLGVARRPLHILVKDSMFRGPLGPVLRAAGQIPVDREGGRSALTTALAVLKRGGAVGVFPEGNRGRGDLAEVRAGVAWLALTSGAPVVPVAVLGTRRTGQKVGAIPGFRRRLYVEVGQPIVVERTPGVSGRATLEAANREIRDALAELVAGAVERSGISLPLDDPNREKGAGGAQVPPASGAPDAPGVPGAPRLAEEPGTSGAPGAPEATSVTDATGTTDQTDSTDTGPTQGA